MTGRAVVPIQQLNRRLPEAGRIRIGHKVQANKRGGGTYERPEKLGTFRFTSRDANALAAIAGTYGGIVAEWNEPKADPGQFEVITGAKEIRVVLPPDPLGGTPIYESWSGGGCERRCDGVSCAVMVKGPDGPEPSEVPCKCNAEGAMACDPHTRLSVILPDVPFGGVWRLDTKGWNAAQELPGMVDLLQSMQQRGLTSGLLQLDIRRSVVAGQTKEFAVPVLALADSIEVLASGGSTLGAGSSAPALASGSSEEAGDRESDTYGRASGLAAPASDDDVVDAEIVDDRTLADVLPEGVTDAKALVAARRVAKAKGLTQPTSVDEVTEPVLIAAVLDELGLIAGG